MTGAANLPGDALGLVLLLIAGLIVIKLGAVVLSYWCKEENF